MRETNRTRTDKVQLEVLTTDCNFATEVHGKAYVNLTFKDGEYLEKAYHNLKPKTDRDELKLNSLILEEVERIEAELEGEEKIINRHKSEKDPEFPFLKKHKEE